MNRASSCSSKSSKTFTPSGTERITIQSEEGTSDEGEWDQSAEEEESSGPNTKSSAKATFYKISPCKLEEEESHGGSQGAGAILSRSNPIFP